MNQSLEVARNMERHRPLKVTGSRQTLKSIVECMGQRNVDGWHRDLDAEKRLSAYLSDDDKMWCFACTETSARRPAVVCLTINSSGQLDVANIVPAFDGSMTVRECNAVLEGFVHALLSPCADEAGVHIDFGEAAVSMSDYMSSECEKKLRAFSGAANKSTGAGHPNDLQRWNAFVIEAHKENAELRPEELQQWLLSEGWDSEWAEELADRYDEGRELLRAFDKR